MFRLVEDKTLDILGFFLDFISRPSIGGRFIRNPKRK